MTQPAHSVSGEKSADYKLTDPEFERFRALVFEETGISLGDQKRALVVGRLSSRLRIRNVTSFSEYYKILKTPSEADERQMAVDLITTNETSFFREIDHFDDLRSFIQQQRPLSFPFRVWSAASSSGEEAYSIAMVLADVLGGAEWKVVGTDISTRVLERARRGLYPMARSAPIPVTYLKQFCLKGTGTHEGAFLIDRRLRDRVSFQQANLCKPLPPIGKFDVAFLRNVLIYFDPVQKAKVVNSVASHIRSQGMLVVGHSESLTGICENLIQVRPTVYRVP